MMGIDTNVLVCFLTKDDESQAHAAISMVRQVADAGESLFLNHMVLCETVWVLQSVYRVERPRMGELIEQLLRTPAFQLEDKDSVIAALRDFRNCAASFADCLIGRRNRASGCDGTYTFDVKAGKLETFRPL